MTTGLKTRTAPQPKAATADEALLRARDARYRWLGAAALVLLVLVSFSPAFSAQFLSWDDADNLIKNPHWRSFTPGSLRWMFTAFHLGHYHPLTWLSFAVEYSFWGMDPSGYHGTNILLHAANAVLFFLLARRLLHIGVTRADPAWGGPVRPDLTIVAGAAAALWAVHPLRVESVAWVTERRDVLSTLFMLLAALAYVGAVEIGAPRLRSQRAYWLAALLLALSCLSKAWGMSFFVLMLALDAYPLRRLSGDPRRWLSRDALRVLAEKTPMILIGLGTAVLAANAQRAAQATKSIAEWPLAGRIVQAFYGLWFYTLKSFAPSNLSAMYQLPPEVHPFEPRFLIAYAFVAAVAAAVVITWRRRPDSPAIPVAALIYLVTLAPVLGLLQSGDQLVADRYSYIATMPLAVLVATGGAWLFRSIRTKAADPARAGPLMGAVAGIAIASLAALSFAQTSTWQDSLSLWSHAVEAVPCSVSYDYLGDEYLRRSTDTKNSPQEKADLQKKALEQYQTAAALDPHDGRAWFCMANIFKDRAQKPEAEHAFIEAGKYLKVAYQAYQNLGYLYAEQGRKEEAIHQFELAVADVESTDKGPRPLSGGPCMALGLARKDQGRLDEAAALFRKAAEFKDTHDDALRQLVDLGKT